MNESELKPTEQDVASYENQVRKSYGDLGKDGIDATHWGMAINIFNGDRANLYTDRKIIDEEFVEPIIRWLSDKESVEPVVMADLGGDDGFLLDEVCMTIKQKLPSVDLHGFVVDIDPTGKAQQRFEKKKENKERVGLEFIKSNVEELPFEDRSIDLIISRMTMQYLDAKGQEAFFVEINRVLKEGGLVEIVTVADFTENSKYNQILSELTYIISGNRNFNRLFPTLSQLKRLAEKLEGSSLKAVFGSQATSLPLSVEGFADRFSLSSDQIEKLNILYRNQFEKYPEMFEIVDGVLCLKTRVLNLRFQKI